MDLSRLALELNQLIAQQIDDDLTLCAFAAVCRQTRAAVYGPHAALWQRRFLAAFDASDDADSSKYKSKYQIRRHLLKQHVQLDNGLTKYAYQCLSVIRDIILGTELCYRVPDVKAAAESFAESDAQVDESSGLVTGKNEAQLHRFFADHCQLLNDICLNGSGVNRVRVGSLYQTIQLVLSHLILDLSLQCPTRNFEISQKMAYLAPNMAPLMIGRGRWAPNVPWLLHICNFFKYHLTLMEEATLFPLYNDLAEHQKPRMWPGRLGQEAKLHDTYWTGSYAYLLEAEMQQIRRQPAGRTLFMDKLDNEIGFQDMHLTAPKLDRETRQEVPELFYDSFQALEDRSSHPEGGAHETSPAEVTDSAGQQNYVRVSGTGKDRDNFTCEGRVYPLSPLQGIPGWKRLILVKYFADLSWPLGYDPSATWFYEGIILPGGQIILGRWWYPDPNLPPAAYYTGPFIFWHSPSSAPEFYDTVNLHSEEMDGPVPDDYFVGAILASEEMDDIGHGASTPGGGITTEPDEFTTPPAATTMTADASTTTVATPSPSFHTDATTHMTTPLTPTGPASYGDGNASEAETEIDEASDCGRRGGRRDRGCRGGVTSERGDGFSDSDEGEQDEGMAGVQVYEDADAEADNPSEASEVSELSELSGFSGLSDDSDKENVSPV